VNETSFSSAGVELRSLNVADGTRMITHVAKPLISTSPPGIIVLQEAYGVNDYLREAVNEFAALGFAAAAPELYHRDGDGITAAYGDRAAVSSHQSALTVEGQVADVAAARDWLISEAGVAADRVAAIGYCMGGCTAYLANSRLPLSAALSFYGANIAPNHLDLVERQHGPLLMVWGGRDRTIPKEQRRQVSDALDDGPVHHTEVVISDAQHGFFGHRRPEYNPAAARLSWALLREFLSVTGLTA
jgi:carboxymethylenebutenolidase